MTVPFVLARSSKAPLQRQIYDQWRTAILARRFRRGERVPSTRAFADAHGVSRVTVTAAYDQLMAEAYFETRKGSGTFVSSELPDEALRPVHVASAGASAARAIRLSAYASRLGAIRQRVPIQRTAAPRDAWPRRRAHLELRDLRRHEATTGSGRVHPRVLRCQ
jgi:DNA-binding transcriptional regulator YhcF (GntR family)